MIFACKHSLCCHESFGKRLKRVYSARRGPRVGKSDNAHVALPVLANLPRSKDLYTNRFSANDPLQHALCDWLLRRHVESPSFVGS